MCIRDRDIRDKYIDPPNTTDFGLMFLPTEGIYAEVLKNQSLVEFVQREYNINITGPTTLVALLNLSLIHISPKTVQLAPIQTSFSIVIGLDVEIPSTIRSEG